MGQKYHNGNYETFSSDKKNTTYESWVKAMAIFFQEIIIGLNINIKKYIRINELR